MIATDDIVTLRLQAVRHHLAGLITLTPTDGIPTLRPGALAYVEIRSEDGDTKFHLAALHRWNRSTAVVEMLSVAPTNVAPMSLVKLDQLHFIIAKSPDR
ncbi:MAG: hypothetical protein A2V98_04795 [Planctomycetes bacterium RBG_16_64_12]|nr:MAG: hypothetical protein A2V98_04795 [Planctomycetes bacterium RBG_16_64_12]